MVELSQLLLLCSLASNKPAEKCEQRSTSPYFNRLMSFMGMKWQIHTNTDTFFLKIAILQLSDIRESRNNPKQVILKSLTKPWLFLPCFSHMVEEWQIQNNMQKISKISFHFGCVTPCIKRLISMWSFELTRWHKQRILSLSVWRFSWFPTKISRWLIQQWKNLWLFSIHRSYQDD